MTLQLAFLINDLRSGGAERLVKDLAIEMQGYEGIEPIVIVANPTGELFSDLEESDIDVVSLGTSVSTMSIPRATWRLSRVLKDREIDLLHSHLPFSHVVGRLACARIRIPQVATYHNVRDHKTRPKRLAERVTGRLSDRIVCVSKGVRESYPDSNRMTVIYNAIDVKGFCERVEAADTTDLEAQHDGERILLNVARCVKQKRQQDLVEAMRFIDDEVHLYIVGDGPCRQEIEKRVTEQSLEECITVTGYVEAIEPYFSVADVFVSSSENEGLPTTHVEASAAKLPIVSTEIAGVTEVITNGETGYLYPVGDYEALARCIETMLNEDLNRVGENAFQHAMSKFTIEQIGAQHKSLYGSCLGVDS
ncbi:glycosyltransferase [Natronorarus salvus]|uniref:glycosyltransferase n=1 Tax=Natronorarus salvus TaxID=3117733 RepID=UPI002F2649E5